MSFLGIVGWKGWRKKNRNSLRQCIAHLYLGLLVYRMGWVTEVFLAKRCAHIFRWRMIHPSHVNMKIICEKNPNSSRFHPKPSQNSCHVHANFLLIASDARIRTSELRVIFSHLHRDPYTFNWYPNLGRQLMRINIKQLRTNVVIHSVRHSVPSIPLM